MGGGELGQGPGHVPQALQVSEAEIYVHRLLGQQGARSEHDGKSFYFLLDFVDVLELEQKSSTDRKKMGGSSDFPCAFYGMGMCRWILRAHGRPALR